jgi:hypothetical protein
MRSRDLKRSNARGYGHSSSGHLSTCSHCNATIYWHKSKTGGWLPPLESYVAGNCSPGESILHECGVKATPRGTGHSLEITVSTRQVTNSPLPVLQTVKIPVTTVDRAPLSFKGEALTVPKAAKRERDLFAAQQLGISLDELKLRRRQQALQDQELHVTAKRLGITVKALRRRGLDGDGANGTNSDKSLSVPRPLASKASGQRTVRTPHQECAGPRGAEWRLERWR